MAGQDTSPNIAALRKLEASLQLHLRDREAAGNAQAASGSTENTIAAPLKRRGWRRSARKAAFIGGPIIGVLLLAVGALFWRLSSGPIEIDLATPWISAAIEENFGQNRQVEI